MHLKVENIFASYGSFEALHGISLEVDKGQIVALLGSNGAGKSTTIKTISGQLIPSQGNIYFKDENINDWPIHKRVAEGIIQVPEGRRVFPYMTVEDNIIAGSYTKHAREKRKDSLERVYNLFPKMYERRTQLAGSLSGGEQQMLAIGRGIMARPRILILDEPSLGLAPIVVDEVFEVIKKINEEGTTILLVEQNVASSLEIADRVFVIETGQNVMNGTGEEMKHNEDLQKAYLGI